MTRRMAKASEKTDVPELPAFSPLELNRTVRLAEAERLCGVSEDSLRRNHSGHVLHLMRK